MRNFLASLFLLFAISNSYALSPEPRIPDNSQEQRAMKLFLEVRCLVCEGQVIENSDTAFSFEMRKLIRRKILEGKNDNEIKSELIEEFGEDILTNSKKSDFLLWLLPLIFAAAIGWFLFREAKK
jgi:cytochrome c-type biogenesis protein CcmH